MDEELRNAFIHGSLILDLPAGNRKMMVAAFQHHHFFVRWAAIERVGMKALYWSDQGENLEKALADECQCVRENAARVISFAKLDFAEGFQNKLTADTNEQCRTWGCHIAGRLAERNASEVIDGRGIRVLINPLVSFFSDSSPMVRKTAVLWLRRILSRKQSTRCVGFRAFWRALATLINVGDDREQQCAYAAVKSNRIFSRLLLNGARKDSRELMRTLAVLDFSRTTSKWTEPLISTLIKMLKDEEVRWAVVLALPRAGEEAFTHLAKAFTTADTPVRRAIVQVVGNARYSLGTDFLLRVLTDGDREVRRKAFCMLRERAMRRPEVRAALADRITELGLEDGPDMLMALGETGDRKKFKSAILTGDDFQKECAVAGLAVFEEEWAVKLLFEALDTTTGEVWIRAAEIIRRRTRNKYYLDLLRTVIRHRHKRRWISWLVEADTAKALSAEMEQLLLNSDVESFPYIAGAIASIDEPYFTNLLVQKAKSFGLPECMLAAAIALSRQKNKMAGDLLYEAWTNYGCSDKLVQSFLDHELLPEENERKTEILSSIVDRDHYSEATVATAVRLLGKIPDLAAQLALVKALQSESPLIRYCAAGAVRGRAVSYRHVYELARE